MPETERLDVDPTTLALDDDPTHVGLIVTFDFVSDRELWRYVPDDVALHVTRGRVVPLVDGVAVSCRVAEPAAVRAAVETLTYVTDVIGFGCTSGSFVDGAAGESRIRDTILAAGARQAVTTSGAMVAASRAIGARRISLVTPYERELTNRLERYLGEHDIEVSASGCFSSERGIHRIPQDALARLVEQVDRDDADAVLISCTGLSTYDLTTALERRLGKPVIGAVPATMWRLLSLVDRVPEIPHRLFEAAPMLDGHPG